MNNGNYCKKCYEKGMITCHGDAMTSYICPKCGKWKGSSSTRKPGYCCPECSVENSCCEECGSKELLKNSEKEEVEREFWIKWKEENK